ncbi:hypothetical protein EDD16DRAFT_1494750, partial [Pisolithus croceorrhizus]
VYRINWLKARARRDRWKEEVSLVMHEMLWTRLWFEYHKNMWSKGLCSQQSQGMSHMLRSRWCCGVTLKTRQV